MNEQYTPAAMRGTAGFSDMQIHQLRDRIEQLMLKHQSEINACLDSWTDSESDVDPPPPPPPPPPPLPSLLPFSSTQGVMGTGCSLLGVGTGDFANLGNGAQSESTLRNKAAKTSPFTSKCSRTDRTRTLSTRARSNTSTSKDRNANVESVDSVVPKELEEEVFALKEKHLEQMIMRTGTHYHLNESRKRLRREQRFLQKLTNGTHYQIAVSILIFLEAVCVGWHTQYMAKRAIDDRSSGQTFQPVSPVTFKVIDAILAWAFVVDLLLRWAADGFYEFFLVREDVSYNVLDTILSTLSVVASLLDIANCLEAEKALTIISVLRLLRFMRVVRFARMIRLMKVFKELRIMVFSISGSMKSLAWVMIVLGFLIYVFGIGFTAAATMTPDHDDDLHEFFGTLDVSMLSLLMAMTGGGDWGDYYFALAPLGFTYSLVFLLFIIFSLFAVANIMAGVFLDAAMQANQMDSGMVVQQELETKKAYFHAMHQIFQEIDTNNTGTLTLEEFDKRLDDERVLAYFNHLNLDAGDARTLFDLLDVDEGGSVTIDEFLVGCYRLQGEASTMDMRSMQCEISLMKESLADLIENVNVIRSCLIDKTAPNNIGT